MSSLDYRGGHLPGAMRQGYKGKFEQAQKGTIYLDEIGEIPHTIQVALLRGHSGKESHSH